MLAASLQHLAHTVTSLAHGLGADAAAALPDLAAAVPSSCTACSPLQDPGIVAPAQAAADAISMPLPDNLLAYLLGPDGSLLLAPHAPQTAPIFSLADAAAAAPAKSDWLSPISDGLEWVLTNIKMGLDRAHVPYSYGWAIVGLTLCTKTLTYPLTKIQARLKLLAHILHVVNSPRAAVLHARALRGLAMRAASLPMEGSFSESEATDSAGGVGARCPKSEAHHRRHQGPVWGGEAQDPARDDRAVQAVRRQPSRECAPKFAFSAMQAASICGTESRLA